MQLLEVLIDEFIKLPSPHALQVATSTILASRSMAQKIHVTINKYLTSSKLFLKMRYYSMEYSTKEGCQCLLVHQQVELLKDVYRHIVVK